MDMKEALRKMYKGEVLTDQELKILSTHLSMLTDMLAFHGETTRLLRTSLRMELLAVDSFIEARGLK